jgi:tetratricopeptide (TPR) repeat protein
MNSAVPCYEQEDSSSLMELVERRMTQAKELFTEQRGDYGLQYWQDALRIHEPIRGKWNSKTAQMYQGIGACLFQQGKHSKALEHFETALAIQQVVGDRYSVQTQNIIENIGRLHMKVYAFPDALLAFQTASRIQMRLQDEEDVDVDEDEDEEGEDDYEVEGEEGDWDDIFSVFPSWKLLMVTPDNRYSNKQLLRFPNFPHALHKHFEYLELSLDHETNGDRLFQDRHYKAAIIEYQTAATLEQEQLYKGNSSDLAWLGRKISIALLLAGGGDGDDDDASPFVVSLDRLIAVPDTPTIACTFQRACQELTQGDASLANSNYDQAIRHYERMYLLVDLYRTTEERLQLGPARDDEDESSSSSKNLLVGAVNIATLNQLLWDGVPLLDQDEGSLLDIDDDSWLFFQKLSILLEMQASSLNGLLLLLQEQQQTTTIECSPLTTCSATTVASNASDSTTTAAVTSARLDGTVSWFHIPVVLVLLLLCILPSHLLRFFRKLLPGNFLRLQTSRRCAKRASRVEQTKNVLDTPGTLQTSSEADATPNDPPKESHAKHTEKNLWPDSCNTSTVVSVVSYEEEEEEESKNGHHDDLLRLLTLRNQATRSLLRLDQLEWNLTQLLLPLVNNYHHHPPDKPSPSPLCKDDAAGRVDEKNKLKDLLGLIQTKRANLLNSMQQAETSAAATTTTTADSTSCISPTIQVSGTSTTSATSTTSSTIQKYERIQEEANVFFGLLDSFINGAVKEDDRLLASLQKNVWC